MPTTLEAVSIRSKKIFVHDVRCSQEGWNSYVLSIAVTAFLRAADNKFLFSSGARVHCTNNIHAITEYLTDIIQHSNNNNNKRKRKKQYNLCFSLHILHNYEFYTISKPLLHLQKEKFVHYPLNVQCLHYDMVTFFIITPLFHQNTTITTHT